MLVMQTYSLFNAVAFIHQVRPPGENRGTGFRLVMSASVFGQDMRSHSNSKQWTWTIEQADVKQRLDNELYDR